MRTCVNHQQYAERLGDKLIKWLRRKSRRLSEQLAEAALILIGLDLEPARTILEPLYSPNPRGRKPYDPVCMLRALILMLLLRYKSIPKFVSDMNTKPRIATIAGFEPDDVPVAGTFYLFIGRLEDGKYQKPCEHIIRPSKLRKGMHLRNLESEKEQRQKDAKADAAVYDSVTRKLKDELITSQDQPRPNDITKRLEDILINCAIIPSAQKGLLGDTGNITVAGDGSALPTGASGNGKPSCKCHENGIYNCQHDRYYSDPTATWGYDSYRDCYYFGHTFYQHVVSTSGHDLPLQVLISNAAETDFTLSMKSMDRLKKALKENGLSWNIEYAVYDCGHDATGIYEYLMEDEITPIIALNTRSGVYPVPNGTAEKVSEDGRPICPAGKLMRRHFYDKKKHKVYYNCPVKRPTHKDGKRCWAAHTEECPFGTLCQPETKMGPIVYVRTQEDPRLYPPQSRRSDKFKRMMKLRSGCERSNSQKKETYRLKERSCRSSVHFIVRLYLVSIIEHAKTWLSELKKKLSGNPVELLKAITA